MFGTGQLGFGARHLEFGTGWLGFGARHLVFGTGWLELGASPSSSGRSTWGSALAFWVWDWLMLWTRRGLGKSSGKCLTPQPSYPSHLLAALAVG